MPFYLRKSLSFGPVRFNLSKGGVGVSAGVTGARVGLNKNGAYVHGGRHGFYYRDKIGKKKRRGSSSGTSSGRSDTIELFVDTGQTYTASAADKGENEAGAGARAASQEKAEAAMGRLAYPFYVFGAGFLFVGIAAANAALILLAPLVAAAGLFYRRRKRAEGERRIKALEHELEELAESERPVEQLKDLRRRPLPGPLEPLRDDYIAEAALLLYIDSGPHFNKQALQSFLPDLDIESSRLLELKIKVLDELLADFIADHVITEEEEQELEELITDLDLKNDDIIPQRHLMQQLIRLRESLSAAAAPVACPLKLTRGESCYYATEGKQLKKRVIETFQRDGIRYNKIGYETDKDGMMYLTNKQLYIMDDGVRSIRLNTILDITCSLEDNTLHLSLNNRVNPIILSVPDAPAFAAQLNYFTEQA